LDLRERKWQEAGEDRIMRSFITCTLHQIVWGDLIKVGEIGGACSTQGAMRNAYKILDRSPAGKRPLGRLTRRWEDNIRMDLREIGWEVVEEVHLPQDRDNCGMF